MCLALGAGALLGSASPASAQGQGSPLGGCSKAFSLRYTGAAEGDAKSGSVSGAVQFECDGTWIFAETISWDEKTIRASGDLLVIQTDLRVNADRMEMDRQTRFGTFFKAYGTARLTDRDPARNMFGSMEPEVMFRAEKLEKIGPRSYRMSDGAFTTCVQPTPRWEMTGSSGTVTLDDHVVMKNVQLRVKHVPVLYVPYLYYPLKKEDRATGFLIPAYSSSGVNGQGLSTAFFWAIDRSQDATIYYDYYSKAGQGLGGDYRYVAAPGSQGNFRAYMLNEKERLASDGAVERPANRWSKFEGSVNQAIGRQFRLIGRVYYYTDQASQLLYQQNVYDQSRRDRDISVQVAGNVMNGRLRLNVLAQRHDIFNGAQAARKSTLPQVDAWLGAKPLGRSKIYFGAAGQATYLDVRPDPTRPVYDRSLWRFDGTSTVRAPLSNLPYLSLTGAAAWRVTHWTESLEPLTGLPVPVALTRNLLDLRADVVGPVVARVFQTPQSGYALRFKHLIEPRVGIQWLSPFDRGDQVIKIDPSVDQLVGGTLSMNYAIVNRLLARVRSTGSPWQVLSVTVGQSYYSNAAAGKIDPNYPSATAGTFSPIQVSATVTPSPSDEVSGRFQMYIDSTVMKVRSYSATAVVSRPQIELQAGWSKRQYLPDVPGFDNPGAASHYLNANATVRTRDGRFGGTYGFNYDLLQNGFLQQRIMGYYSAQCCGVSVDYQTINISQFGLEGVQRVRRIAVSFTLAGIGSFSTPLGAFGR